MTNLWKRRPILFVAFVVVAALLGHVTTDAAAVAENKTELSADESDNSIGALIDIVRVSNQIKLVQADRVPLLRQASVNESSTSTTETASSTTGSSSTTPSTTSQTTPTTTSQATSPTTTTVTTSTTTTTATTATTTATSTSSTTTSTLPPSACLRQQTLANSSQVLAAFENYYDVAKDSVNFKFTLSNARLPLGYAISIVGINGTLVLFGKVDGNNNTLEKADTVSNTSKLSWDNSSRQLVISFSMPRQPVFSSYDADLRDCYRFTIAISEAASNYTLNTTRICSDACGTIAKTPVTAYISMDINNVEWSSADQAFLNTSNALQLIARITGFVNSTITSSDSFYLLQNFTVLKIGAYPPRSNNLRRHRRAPNTRVWFNSLATLGSSNSPSFTRSNLNSLLNEAAAKNSDQLDIRGIQTLGNPPSDPTQTTGTSTDVMTTTINPNADPNYSRNLAIALVVSLIIVVGLIVAGLFGFTVWKKKRFSGDSYSAATPSRNANNNFGGGAGGVRASRTRQNNMVRLDNNSHANHFADDEFELNYSNPAFTNDQHQDYNGGQYTDFTGSREVGIDIGPIDEEIGYTNPSSSSDYQFNPNRKHPPGGAQVAAAAKISLNPSLSPQISKHQPYNVMTSTTNNSTNTGAGLFSPTPNSNDLSLNLAALSASSKKYIKEDDETPSANDDDDDEFNILDEMASAAKSNLARFKNSENLFAEPAESPINRRGDDSSSVRSAGSQDAFDKLGGNSKEDLSDQMIDQRFSDLLNDRDLKELMEKSDSKSRAASQSAGFYHQTNSSLFNDRNQVIEEENENESEAESDQTVADERTETELKSIFKKDLDQNILESLNTFGFDPVDHMIQTTTTSSAPGNELSSGTINKTSSLKRKNTGGKKSPRSSLPRANAPLGFSSNDSFEPEHDSDMSSVEIDADLNKKRYHDPFMEQQQDSEDLDDISVDIPDDDGFKEIDSNALKHLKLQSNNFVLANAESLPTIKDLIVKPPLPKPEGKSFSKSNSLENDNDDDDIKNSASMYANKIIEGAMNKSQSNLLRESYDFAEIPKPRICVIRPSAEFDGLGIHLFNNKEHMIKEIEPSSPAALSGLKPGDKIIGVDTQDVTEKDNGVVVLLLKNALANRKNIELTVMNTVEWNIFNKYAKTNLSTDSLQTLEGQVDVEKENLKNELLKTTETSPKQQQLDPFGGEHDLSTASGSHEEAVQEFNPFQDVPSETHSPFLHYSSILPPSDFQAGVLPNDAEEEVENESPSRQQSSPFDEFDNIMDRSKTLLAGAGDEDDESSFGSELKRITTNRQAGGNTFTLAKNEPSATMMFLNNLNESSSDTAKVNSAQDFDQNFADLLQLNNPADAKELMFDPSPFEISPKSKDTSLTSSSSSTTTSTSSNRHENEFYLPKPPAGAAVEKNKSKGVKSDFSIWNASVSDQSEPSLFP